MREDDAFRLLDRATAGEVLMFGVCLMAVFWPYWI